MAPDDSPLRMIEVWFSSHQKHGEAALDRVKRFILQAKSSLDVAVYSLTHDWLKPAFQEIQKKGVKIRILMDKCQASVKKSDWEYYRQLGIPVALDVKPGLMHHKFAIRDRSAVLTGSYNWTESAQNKNQENLLVILYPHVVKAYETEFNQLWEENKAGIGLVPDAQIAVAPPKKC